HRLLLITRDGVHLEPLFRALFADACGLQVHLLHMSRQANKAASRAYRRYLRAHYVPGDTLLWDLQGSFATGRDLFRDLLGDFPDVEVLFTGG
ncbi:hypothetical protein OFB80_29085, partial [Escherichia coli]|nr:hypothetical protein [Escherichia coli]